MDLAQCKHMTNIFSHTPINILHGKYFLVKNILLKYNVRKKNAHTQSAQ